MERRELFNRNPKQSLEEGRPRQKKVAETISIEMAPVILAKILNSPGGKEVLSRLFLQQDGEMYDEHKKGAKKLTDEQVAEQVTNLLQIEERQLESVREANKETIQIAHQDLKLIAEACQFNWRKGTEVHLVGPRMYSLYLLADNLQGELPPEKVRAGCDVGGQYFPNIDQAVVNCQQEKEKEDQPFERFLYHAMIHEGLHSLGGKIYNQNGKVIDRGIGGGAANSIYAQAIEEGFVEWQTQEIELRHNKGSSNRYSNEVALLEHFKEMLGDNFLKGVIIAHREGEDAKLQSELNRIFGQGFFELYRGLNGQDSLAKHWAKMSKEEIRVFTSLVTTGERPKIVLPPYNDDKVMVAVKDHFIAIANKIMTMSLTGIPQNANRAQLLTMLPRPVRVIFQANFSVGFTIREQVEKAINEYVSGL